MLLQYFITLNFSFLCGWYTSITMICLISTWRNNNNSSIAKHTNDRNKYLEKLWNYVKPLYLQIRAKPTGEWDPKVNFLINGNFACHNAIDIWNQLLSWIERFVVYVIDIFEIVFVHFCSPNYHCSGNYQWLPTFGSTICHSRMYNYLKSTNTIINFESGRNSCKTSFNFEANK